MTGLLDETFSYRGYVAIAFLFEVLLFLLPSPPPPMFMYPVFKDANSVSFLFCGYFSSAKPIYNYGIDKEKKTLIYNEYRLIYKEYIKGL